MELDKIMSALPAREGEFDPCFAFSIHKCGSTLMHAMIFAVCHQEGIPSVSLPDVFFDEGLFEKDWQRDTDLLPAFDKKILYYGFRNLPAILTDTSFRLFETRFVLLVRDPRDALVSEYFSFGRRKASHRPPKNNPAPFLKQIEEQPDLTIDKYVIRASQNISKKFEDYRDNMNFDLGLVRRYEDVFYDKENFLREIFDHFGINVPSSTITAVAKKHDIRPEKEDNTKHIRKGIPGDHKGKLAPETIARLNDIFREIGLFYGYNL